MPHPAPSGVTSHVDGLDREAHDVTEDARPDEAREQQPGGRTVDGGDKDDAARRGEERTDLVPQALTVARAELGADRGLGASLEAQPDERGEVVRLGRTHLDV